MKDYYKILNIDINDNIENIKKSYKIKISQFNNLPFFTKKMIGDIKEIKEAYYVLKNKNLKDIYNKKNNKGHNLFSINNDKSHNFFSLNNDKEHNFFSINKFSLNNENKMIDSDNTKICERMFSLR